MRAPRKSRTTLHTSPRNLQAFFANVWDLVADIPRGRLATYSQLARLVGRPRGTTARHFRAAGARWVGRAMAASPPGIPWWRVINAQGKISPRSEGDSHIRQRRLLEQEGIVFDHRGRADLHRFQWQRNL